MKSSVGPKRNPIRDLPVADCKPKRVGGIGKQKQRTLALWSCSCKLTDTREARSTETLGKGSAGLSVLGALYSILAMPVVSVICGPVSHATPF